MHDKATLLYTAGSYGSFLLNILNKNEISPSEYYHDKHIDYKFTNGNIYNHHLLKEHDLTNTVIKITYTDNDISLINRNKWHKVQNHLQEQSLKTFPNNKNKELYSMAIHVCNLLDKNNHFRKIENYNNIEVKFNWFLEDFNSWLKNFGNVFKKLDIPFDSSLLERQHIIFNKSQQNILKQEKYGNDLISKSYKLAKKYFLKYNTEYSEMYFDNIYKSLEDT